MALRTISRDEHRDHEPAQPFDRRDAHRGVGEHAERILALVAETGEHGGRHAQQESLDQALAVRARMQPHADRAQAAAQLAQHAVGHDDHVGRIEMDERENLRARLLLEHGHVVGGAGAQRLSAGELEVGGRERLIVQIHGGCECLGIEQPGDHQPLAEDADGRAIHLAGSDVQRGRHRGRQQAGRLVVAREEATRAQCRVDTGDRWLAVTEAQQTGGAVHAPLVPDLGVPLLLFLQGGVPAARTDHRPVAEVRGDIVQHRLVQRVPAAVAHEHALVAAGVRHAEGQVAHLRAERGEGQHGEGQQHQRGQRQSSAQLSPPHVRDAQEEGRIGRARPADVRLVDVRGSGLVFAQVTVEAGGDHGHDQRRHGHDGERQQDHQGMRDGEGWVDLRDRQPDQQQQEREAAQLPANVARGEQQALAEEGGRDDEGEEEHDAPDHVVERRDDLGIGPRDQPRRFADGRHVPVPFQTFARRGGALQQRGGTLVQVGEALVLDRVAPHGAETRVVQAPHVPSGQEGGVLQGVRSQPVPLAARLSLGVAPGAVQQEQLAAHEQFESVLARLLLGAEEHGDRLLGACTAQEPVLPGRHAVAVDDLYQTYLVQPARIQEAVQRRADAREQHQRFLVGFPANLAAEQPAGGGRTVELLGALAQVRRVHHRAVVGREDVGGHRHGPRDESGREGIPFGIGHEHAVAAYSLPRHGSAQQEDGLPKRTIRNLAAPRERAGLEPQTAQLVGQDGAEVLEVCPQVGIPQCLAEKSIEQLALPLQVGVVDSIGGVERRVDAEAGIVDGHQRQRDQAGIERGLAVVVAALRHERAPVHAPYGADAG